MIVAHFCDPAMLLLTEMCGIALVDRVIALAGRALYIAPLQPVRTVLGYQFGFIALLCWGAIHSARSGYATAGGNVWYDAERRGKWTGVGERDEKSEGVSNLRFDTPSNFILS